MQMAGSVFGSGFWAGDSGDSKKKLTAMIAACFVMAGGACLASEMVFVFMMQTARR
jgi:hypothetical protein